MLNPAERKALKARAHKLEPVVIIGAKGLTDEVVKEVDLALKAHELIKVRAVTDDRAARSAWMKEICTRLEAHAVQEIGKVLVIYRENFDKPRAAPRVDPPPRRKARGDERETTARSVRPRSRTTSPPRESVPRRRRRSTSR